MKHLLVALFGAAVLSAAVSTMSTPASALGGCGPNRHRGPYGACVWGGQNQNWCLRHTGHVAAYVGYGRRRCF